MRKIAIAMGVLLAFAAPVAKGAPALAGPAKPKSVELALFQERTIFKSGLRNAHTIALTFDDGPNAHTAEVLARSEQRLQIALAIADERIVRALPRQLRVEMLEACKTGLTLRQWATEQLKRRTSTLSS